VIRQHALHAPRAVSWCQANVRKGSAAYRQYFMAKTPKKVAAGSIFRE
jgi:hypothetical protein